MPVGALGLIDLVLNDANSFAGDALRLAANFDAVRLGDHRKIRVLLEQLHQPKSSGGDAQKHSKHCADCGEPFDRFPLSAAVLVS